MIHVIIPPLRDRSDDILPLAQCFVREFSETFARDVHGFTPSAEQALLDHPWPGNVRELRNRIERAVALSQAPRIGVEALFPSEPAEPDAASLATLAEVRDRAERQHIRAALADVDNRIRSVLRRRGPGGFGGSGPGSGTPLAPTPVMPDRPKPRSGGAAAHVEVTAEPPPDVIARRIV